MHDSPTAGLNFRDRLLWIVVGLALLSRWLHLAFIAGTDLVRIPIIDSGFYSRWAAQIASGDLIGEGVFFMSPLYPYFLGLIYALVGEAPLAALLLQSLTGAATIGFLFLLTERWFGRRAAAVAGILGALYSPFIFYDGTLLTANLILLLSAAILYLATDVLERPSPAKLLGLGALIGLSALARPLALIFLPFLWRLLHLSERSASAKRFGLALAGVALILLPVSLRNLIAGGEFTLTTSSAGMNFYVGANPDATGLYWEAPFLSSAEPEWEDEDYRAVASEAVGRNLTTREAGSYWGRTALDWAINNPVDYLKLVGRKIFYFWNRAEFANNVSIYVGRELSPLQRYNPLGFWLAAPLGLAGLILLYRSERRQKTLLPIFWISAYFAGCVVFFVSSEYRLPIVLPLLAGAGWFLTYLFDQLKAGRYDPALKAVVVVLLFMPLVNFRTGFIVRGENARMDWFNFGNTLLKRGDGDAAAIRFNRSLEIDPAFAEGYLRLAEAYYRAGKPDKAIEIGKRAGLDDPQSVLKIVQGNALQEAYALLGEGKLEEAVKEFAYAGYDSTIAAAETTRVSLLNRARSEYEAGRMEEALQRFRDVAARDSVRDPAVFYNIAFLHWQQGRPDSARVFAEEVMKVDSLNVPAGFLLVRIYNAIGMHEEADRLARRVNPSTDERDALLKTVRLEMDAYEARGEWQKALESYGRYGRLAFDTAPEDKYRLGRLQIKAENYDLALRLLTEAEAALISDPKLAYYQGLALIGLERTDEASASFQKAVAAAPELVEARISLARIYLKRGSADRAFRELDAVAHIEITAEQLAREYKGLLDSVKAKL